VEVAEAAKWEAEVELVDIAAQYLENLQVEELQQSLLLQYQAQVHTQ
jgi:hypothetical protein